MASLEDAGAIAMALPDVTEVMRSNTRTWKIGTKGFAWERPLTKADIKRWGDDPLPDGPILAVRVEDLHDKEAVLAAGTKGVFTMSHFDGYAAVLIELDVIAKRALTKAIEDAWLSCAPDKLAAEFLATRRRRA